MCQTKLDCFYFVGGISKKGTLLIDPATWNISYYNGTVYVIIASLPASPSYPMWVTIKLVMDFTTGFYVRAVIGQNTFDLSTIPVYGGAASQPNGALFYAITGTNIAANNKTNIGHFILTTDEP